jgi:hypothetical protein
MNVVCDHAGKARCHLVPKCRHRKSHREGYGCAGETAECRTKEWQLVYAKVRCVPVKRRKA